MNRTLKIYVFFLILLLAGIVYIDINRPKPINWSPTYSIKDKIPFGLYVFDNEIKSYFKNQKIEKINTTPYEYLIDLYDYDTLVNNYKINGTAVNISEYSDIDKQSVEELLIFVSRGNTAFLSSKELPMQLLDSLKVRTKLDYKFNDSIFNWVANKKLDTKKYKITEGLGNNYFSKIDTLNTTVLGYQNGDSTRVNYIKVKYYDGEFLLHTQPTAFTNFHLLKGDHFEYAQKVLSYIPKNNIFWFIKNQDGQAISQSPMRYILKQPALKYAWYIFLIGTIIFIIFNAKRKQRIIPIKKPLPNTTVDFTKTIGNLYYQEGDHDNIINKKIVYFLERIRNVYLIDTNKLDDEFIKKLHLKSGKDLSDIQRAVFLINTHRKSPHSSIEEDLIQINKAIEKIIN